MKNNIILYSIILVLICVVVGLGLVIYQNKISDMDGRIVALNNQIVALQAENYALNSRGVATAAQINQLTLERDKAKNIRAFVNVEELRSFLSNNSGYNFGANVYDNSDVCVKMILAAKNQGYWMGLMPKQNEYYRWYEDRYYSDSKDRYYTDPNTSWIYEGDRYYSLPSYYSYYGYGNYSFSKVVNVAIVGSRDIYTIESGVATYVGSMAVGF